MSDARIIDPFEILRRVRARRTLANNSHSAEESGESRSVIISSTSKNSSQSSRSSRPELENAAIGEPEGREPDPAKVARPARVDRGAALDSIKEKERNNNNINILSSDRQSGGAEPDSLLARVAKAARVAEIPLISNDLARTPLWLEFCKSGKSDQAADFLVQFEERAAILEYDGGWSRAEAETLAAAEIVAQWSCEASRGGFHERDKA